MESNGLSIKRINPKLHDRYSPNLYRWLNSRSHKHRLWTSRVYSDDSGTLWVGMIDEPGPCFSGAKLIAVLCNGGREQSAAYLKNSFVKSLSEVSGFWQRYADIGRCAIDPGHTMYFVNEDTRWEYDDDNNRHCVWCGAFRQRQRMWQETVDRKEWAPITKSCLINKGVNRERDNI